MDEEYVNHIKQIRERKNMTQQELAERLGTSVRNIRRWENGESVPDAVISIKICKVLDVNFMELFEVLGTSGDEK